MDFLDIVEARTTTLQKLKNTNAVDVASDFPEEFIRILFDQIEKAGIEEIKSESKKKVLNKIREKMADSFSGRNPLTDSNNHLKFEVETESGNEIQFNLLVSGNTFDWEVGAGQFYRHASGTTKLRNKSVAQAFEELVQKLHTAITSPDMYKASEEEAEEFLKKMKQKPEKAAEIVSRVAKYFGMRGGQEGKKSSRGIQIYLRPSSEIIGIPHSILDKIRTESGRDAFNTFKYTYQTEQLDKAFKVLVQRLESSNYMIRSLGFAGDEYLFMYVDQMNPGRINTAYSGRHTYKEVHDIIKKDQFKHYLSSLEDKVQYATKEQARRDFIERVFERLG